MKSYRFYIVRCKDKSYYTGVTGDLENRLWYHNHSKENDGYTSTRKSVHLVYSEETHDINAAIQREKQIKGRSRKKKEMLINGEFEQLKKYSK